MAFLRQGVCSRDEGGAECGQCCGAEGSPNQANPWPKNWFEHHRNWQFIDFEAQFQYMNLFGIVPDVDGKPLKAQDVGSVRFTGGGPARDYYYTWVEGRPCKDTSAAHDGSSHSLECPFLVDDPGDGTRPCGLVDEIDQSRIEGSCWFQEPVRFEQRQKDEWEANHPLCSYTWLEE